MNRTARAFLLSSGARSHRFARRALWPRGYDAWAVPYTQSTLIVDVIDARTNQLVWRGYDTDTLKTGKPEKTLDSAVDHVVSKLAHDMKEERPHV